MVLGNFRVHRLTVGHVHSGDDSILMGIDNVIRRLPPSKELTRRDGSTNTLCALPKVGQFKEPFPQVQPRFWYTQRLGFHFEPFVTFTATFTVFISCFVTDVVTDCLN